MTLDDFAIRHGIEALFHDEQLLEAFKRNERVTHNARNNTWSWKPDYDVRTPQDLLNVVQTRYYAAFPPERYGFRLSELRESYPATREAVDSFAKRAKRRRHGEANGDSTEEKGEADGPEQETKKLLVVHGNKEGQIKQVYFNEASTPAYMAHNDGKRIEPIDEGAYGVWRLRPCLCSCMCVLV